MHGVGMRALEYYLAASWRAVATPQAAIDGLHAEIARASSSSRVGVARSARRESVGSTPAEVSACLNSEIAKWTRSLSGERPAGLSIDSGVRP